VGRWGVFEGGVGGGRGTMGLQLDMQWSLGGREAGKRGEGNVVMIYDI